MALRPAGMTNLPILYSFRRCPYAMRARMALWVSGISVELREIILREKPVEMLIASPKATVPVLVLPDGTVIDESLEIMNWALHQNDPKSWLDAQNGDMIAINDGPFKQALDRYKYPSRYDLVDGIAFRQEGLTYVTAIEDVLTKTRYLSGANIGLTDIAIFPFIRQFAATDQIWFDELPLPQLQKWLIERIESDMFNAIMLRYPIWRNGDAASLFHSMM